MPSDTPCIICEVSQHLQRNRLSPSVSSISSFFINAEFARHPICFSLFFPFCIEFTTFEQGSGRHLSSELYICLAAPNIP